VRAQETWTADAVERFLHENEIAVLVEDGGICLVPFLAGGAQAGFDSRILTRSTR